MCFFLLCGTWTPAVTSTVQTLQNSTPTPHPDCAYPPTLQDISSTTDLDKIDQLAKQQAIDSGKDVSNAITDSVSDLFPDTVPDAVTN